MVVSLNCIIYGDEPAFRHIFKVKVSPKEDIADVRERIWDKTKVQYSLLDETDIALYIPETAISIANEEPFEHKISQLDFNSREGGVKKLDYTFRVDKYDTLAKPGNELLHIIVVVPTSKYSTYGLKKVLISRSRTRR
jgi:hypothetical protein